VSCSVRLSENMVQRIGGSSENVFPAANDHVVKATDAISRGQVVAVPTDTIYGFTCDAWLVFSHIPAVLGEF
jgi:tRNA A37 threonylcarbamoyladenosine synthetase subunit TsaC/SUA5/YrdC